MYYIVNEEEGLILEIVDKMSDEVIKEAAKRFECDVYAIQGEHSGYAARHSNEIQE